MRIEYAYFLLFGAINYLTFHIAQLTTKDLVSDIKVLNAIDDKKQIRTSIHVANTNTNIRIDNPLIPDRVQSSK